MKNTNTVRARCNKGRKSFFSILSIDPSRSKADPIVLASLIEKVTIPTMLFGCELWSRLTASDVLKLERCKRMFAKAIQKLPQRTRTDMALSMLGWLPIIQEVDKRKLSFLHKLCTMPTYLLSRKIFSYRLHLFLTKGCRSQMGFIPDIFAILSKYSLTNYLLDFTESSRFPSKLSWKRIVSKTVHAFHEAEWTQRMNTDNDFDQFIYLHNRLSVSAIWTLPISICDLHVKYDIARVWTSLHHHYSCTLCGSYGMNLYQHLTIDCDFFRTERSVFMHKLSHTNSHITQTIIQLRQNELYYTLLGSKLFLPENAFDSDCYLEFLAMSLKFISEIVTSHGNVLRAISNPSN